MTVATGVTSGVVLALEIAHVRVLSYATDPRLVYGAIAVAMAAMGAASITVALRPSLVRGDVRPRVALVTMAFSAAIVGSSALFAHVAPWFDASSAAAVITRALPVLLVLGLPYYPGGLAVSLALAGGGGRLPRLYAASLVGSAVGSFALFPFMRSAGLEVELVVLAAAAAATAAGLALASGARRIAFAAAGLCLASVALAPVATSLVPLEPDPRDLLAAATATYVRTHPDAPSSFRPRREHAAWDPVSRVEVYAFPGSFGRMNARVPIRLVTQDGGAASIFVGFGPIERPPSDAHRDARIAWAERSVYGVGYLVRPRPPRVLVVGTGGGVDVATALHHGARSVTAVEINGAMIEAARDRYTRFQSGLLSRPEVELVHADGRSFAEQAARAGRRWPLVQMSGADTYSAGTAGAFMFSESYLYTLDAFRRYLALLEPDGVLALIRFGPEPLRTVVTAGIALRELGITEPQRHVVVLRQGICSAIVVSRRPLDRQAVGRVLFGVATSAHGPFVSLPMWDAMGFGFGEPLRVEHIPSVASPDRTFRRALEATASSEALSRFLEPLPLDYSPTTDDRPFFFQFLKPAALVRLDRLDDREFFASGLLGHVRLLVGFLIVAALLTLLPPLVSALRNKPRDEASRALDAETGERRPAEASPPLPLGERSGERGGPSPSGWLTIALYYSAIGLGFMLLEIVLVQRTVLFLGHPTASVATTLAALLVGSGIGSALSGRPAGRARPVATVVLAIALGLAWMLALELTRAALADGALALPIAARAFVVVLAVAPLGVALGVPFPAGTRVLVGAGEVAPSRLAWALGVNGFAGTLASLVAVPVAMVTGFRVVTWTAAAFYAIAAAVVVLVGISRSRRSARPSKP